MGTERDNVRKELEEYFAKKKNHTLLGFGKFKKEQLSAGTGLYIIEIDVEQWTGKKYALVTTSRAHPQGKIILDSIQISTAVRMLIDGLEEDF